MKESWRYKKVKCYKCGQIGHPSFVCYKEEKRCQDEEGKQEHVVYYCLEQVDEEKQEVLEAIQDTYYW